MSLDIKYAAFDFDETLCIHTGHKQMTDDAFFEENVACVARTCNFPDGRISTPIQQFMLRLEDRGIPMGLISATKFFVRAEAKRVWVEENYGVELQQICVAESTDKVNMLKYIAAANGFQNHQILIVDDYYAVLHAAAAEGFMAMSPVEVVEAVLGWEL